MAPRPTTPSLRPLSSGPTKLFLPSVDEIADEASAYFIIGSALSGSSDGALREFLTTGGLTRRYWFRSIKSDNYQACYYHVYDVVAYGDADTSYPIRVTMVLDSDAMIDENGNITAGGSSLGGFVKIGSEYRELSSGYVKIGSEYREITGSFKRIGGEYT